MMWGSMKPASLRSEVQGQQAEVDQLLPDVLLFPAGSDLHDHPLVANGSLVLQVRLLSMQP